jgi:hypothetical protein
VVDEAARAFARWAAALRGKRLLHPAGATFTATFTVTARTSLGVPFLDEPGEYRAVARLSKATSTSSRWPDVLGLAWRVVDAGGPGVPLDLALSSAGHAVVTRHLLVPRRDFAAATYTSLLPYRLGRENRYLAAFPDRTRGVLPDTDSVRTAVAAHPFELSIRVARRTGPWWPVATLRLDQPSDDDLSINPVSNVVPGLAPAGWLNRLRGPVYRGSQAGRASSSA